MKLINNGIIKFDRQYPMYNFFFPNQKTKITNLDISHILHESNNNSISRALYFHIPFCETICSFCPFTRGMVRDPKIIDTYIDALINEIEIKSKIVNLKEIPVSAIFFGGGSPSILNEEQILKIGEKIHKEFNLNNLKEFSYEIEIKSLTKEKALALKHIGVTHPRFGLQTFNKKWRDIFDLTSTIDQINNAANILNELFSFVSFDILYGMSGQEENEIISDLESAINLRTSNIDIYPIDNIVTQPRLHHKLKSLNMNPTPALRKFNMNVLIDKYMRSKGFMPHNGHGYYRTESNDHDILTDKYRFVYHEHVYGYSNYDLLGFGVNAISNIFGYVITNTSNRGNYINNLSKNIIPCSISKHDNSLDHTKPLILRLPYHGFIEKNKVNLNLVRKDVLKKINTLIENKLLVETKDEFKITKIGWYWYVNIIYYLMPEDDQKILNSFIVSQLKDTGRYLTQKEVLI